LVTRKSFKNWFHFHHQIKGIDLFFWAHEMELTLSPGIDTDNSIKETWQWKFQTYTWSKQNHILNPNAL
jgi:hypothetical protein